MPPVDRSRLETELKGLHAQSWGWALACAGRDRDLAQDVLQTAYVRMVSGEARWDERSTFRTWVFGVIRMVGLEELRRGRRSAARLNGEEGALVEPDPAPGPDILSERSERAAALAEALGTLSARQQEVLLLVFYHGLTIDEAARVMKVSLGSARTHYKRGKANLAVEIAHLREDVK